MTQTPQTAGVRPSPARVQDPTALAVAAATAYLEVRAGRRPARQLERLLSPVVRVEMAQMIRDRRGQQPAIGGISVLRVVTSQPSPHILDAAVVCRDGSSHTAVAVRVELRRSGWAITALSTPEDQARLRRRGTS
jgi:hypothetical protein